jgi:hypothetical protein
MTEIERQMVSVACTIVDALKNINQRLLCFEYGTDRYPHQDAVWESINRGAEVLKALNQLPVNPNPDCPECEKISQREDFEGIVQCICGQRHVFPAIAMSKLRKHGETCNCDKCRVSRGGEPV